MMTRLEGSTGAIRGPLHGGASRDRRSAARMEPRKALDLGELLDVALTRARRADFPDRSFIPSLERLIVACSEEANLSPLGARAVRFDILRCLRNQLRFDELETRDPGMLTKSVEAPVFITGMPRSGTTFLHRLILQDPNTIAPRLFQLVHPSVPKFGSIETAVRKACLRLQLLLFRTIARELHVLHPIGVDDPEECTDITAQVFRSGRFESMYHVPSYNEWLHRVGFLDAYRFHRRFLQHLQWQEPPKRWILKSPDHVFALDDIRRIYPDAHFVLVHRDPVRVLASVAKLTEVLRRPFTHRIDRMEIGRSVSASWIDGSRRMAELSSTGCALLHLHYRQVVSSPLEAVAAVYRHAGLTLTAQAEERMVRWLRTAAAASGRRREYSLTDFGLDARLLRDRFARYTETFQVEIEQEGRPLHTGAPA